jgi:predicted permease
MTPGELWRRVLFFCRRNRMAEDLEEEMHLHIALRANKLNEQHCDSVEAVYAARRQFGNKTLLKEVSREMWGWISIERFLQDVRLAARSLRRNALFSAMAIATFALGIGANTAIFSVVNAVLLRPLPYPRPDAIVHMSLAWKSGDLNNTLTVPEFEFYRDHSSAFQAVAGYRGGATVSIKRGDVPEWITSLRTTDGFFRVLGIHPAMGRDIQRDDTRPGSPQVAILSDSLWRNAFGADPAIIGRQIELNDLTYMVVGIMPPEFTFVEQPADVFVPLQLGRSIADTGMNTRVIARLKPKTTIAQAQANMNVVFESLRQQGSVQSGQRGIQLESYQKWLAGDFRTSVLMLFGAVSLLLLIACANVASLLMARASSRQREISVRLAIGSGRLHLLQQFLAESLLIAIIGSVAGLIAANWALRGLISTIPWDIPLTTQVHLDIRVLGFTSLLTVGTSLIFGLTSYWQATRLDLNTSLKEGAPGAGRTAAQNRARSVLVTSEIAVSLMLLVGAGLLIESIYRLHQQRLGFDPRHVYTMTTPFGPAAKLNAMQIWNFEQDVLRRIQATPGITSAAVASQLPLTGPDNLPTQHEGHPEHSIGGMEYRAISSQYFRTMRIPIIEGRAFTETDTASATPVAIVSESVARAWWRGKSPIGDRIVVGEYKGRQFPEVLEQPRQIVGVVADVKNLAINEAAPTTVYVPASQLTREAGSAAWVVRGTGNSSLSTVLRKAVTAVSANQRVLNLQPMSDIVARSMARPSFNASLMATFAALALILTSVGIYGLLSFQVARRTKEIGIRMALGAKRTSVLFMVIKHGALLAVVGIAIGAAGAVFLTRLLSSLLAGVRTTNPLIYALVSVLLLFIALLASYLPARRASKIDPLVALRYE